MATQDGIEITLTLSGYTGADLIVAACRGEEAISRPYRFVLDLICEDPRWDLRELLYREAVLTLTGRFTERRVHAVLTGFDQLGDVTSGRAQYQAILEPVLAKLAMSRQNQIYGTDEDVSVVDVVTAELTGTGARGPAVEASAHLDVDCLRTEALTEDYPRRDYLVQYEETDLAFISRLMEHWGIFYFFTDDGEKERLHLGDRNVAFRPIDPEREEAAADSLEDTPQLRFEPGSGLQADGEEHVFALKAISRPLPHKIILRDYNDQLPQLPAMHAEAVVDERGHGVIASYGEHFETPEEGQTLAQIRAEALKCRALRFEMRSNCPRLSAGRLFRLTGHGRDAFNQLYIVAEVRHEAGLPRSDGAPEDAPAPGYRNTIIAVPFDMADGAQFRPERLTPVPRVHGLMTAHVDAAGLGDRAELDDQGRYKVRIPFDMTGAEDGKASRYIRKAQPYAGKNSGMHFPLLKGTEVAIACYNGDPNRPLITGAVPNPLTQSVSVAGSADRNRIQTTSNILIELGDGMTPPADPPGAGHLAGPVRQTAARDAGHAAAPLDTVSESSTATACDVWLRLNVADKSYLRLGDAPAQGNAEEDPFTAQDVQGEAIQNGNGWFSYTEGDRNDVTLGNSANYVAGEQKQVVGSSSSLAYWSNQYTEFGGTATKLYLGFVTNVFIINKNDYILGVKTAGVVGASISLNLSFSFVFALKKVAVTLFTTSVAFKKWDHAAWTTGIFGVKTEIAGTKNELIGAKDSKTLADIKDDLIKKKKAALVMNSSGIIKTDEVVALKKKIAMIEKAEAKIASGSAFISQNKLAMFV